MKCAMYLAVVAMVVVAFQTRVEAAEHVENDEITCIPGEVFRRECNWCTCPRTALRSKAACTLKLCLPDDYV